MAKRLTRSDYIFTLVFIFMLVCVIAAFFIGLKLGKENTEQKYEQLLADQEMLEIELTAYHQQYLVSFYHTTFLPYRDFQRKWFEHLSSLELKSATTDVQSVFKDLARLADQQYRKMISSHIPDTSPLLQQAHEDYLRSLKLFNEAMKQDHLMKLQGSELIQEINNDAFVIEAIRYGLSAQYHYYASIVAWQQPMDSAWIDGINNIQELTISEWQALGIHEKNAAIAAFMQNGGFYELYFVHDVTIRVDDMITSGQAERMGFHHIADMMTTLIETKAIRSGDFNSAREFHYANETFPQLPFFFE